MSTIAYATLTKRRLEQQSLPAPAAAPPGVSTVSDTLLALVPAEVLAAHTLILQLTTTTEEQATTISSPQALGFAFWALALLPLLFYWFSRITSTTKSWQRGDCIRLLIPSAAFVAWTMLQRPSAFYAAFPKANETWAAVIAVLSALVLAFLAKLLGDRANPSSPPTKQPPAATEKPSSP